MADLSISMDDALYVTKVTFEYCVKDLKTNMPTIRTVQRIIGPYTNKRAIKNQLTRLRKRHERTPEFEILEIKTFITEFDWKVTVL